MRVTAKILTTTILLLTITALSAHAQAGTLFVEGANVGIGTATPSARLDVVNTAGNADLRFFSAASANIILDRGNLSSFSRFQFHTGGALKWSMGMVNDQSNDFHLGISAFLTDFYISWATGRVGIGTSSPQGQLDVNGAIFQRGGLLHADYVFDPAYELESIESHAERMWQEHHLPAMPKATADSWGREVVEIGAHRRGIVEELEKAHIYIEQLNDHLKTKDELLTRLTAQVEALETRLATVESAAQP